MEKCGCYAELSPALCYLNALLRVDENNAALGSTPVSTSTGEDSQ
ncbi:MAG: hypothetical protein ACLR23_26290 [Clostridia bacterium]